MTVNQIESSQLTANKLIANQRFCYGDLVTDFVAVISSQSEDLGKMALGISSQPIGVVCGQFVRGQFVMVSCRGPNQMTPIS